MSRLRALVLQLAGRLRSLEAMAFVCLILPVAHPIVTEMQGGLRAWQEAVKASPTEHGLGGAENLLAIHLLRGVYHKGLAANADEAIRARVAALMLLLGKIGTLPIPAISEFWHHAVVATLQGRRLGSALVALGVDGKMALPAADAVQPILDMATEAMRSGNPGPLAERSITCFTIVDGVPVQANGPGLSIQRVLVTVMCSTGATKPAGRPPPSAAERNLRKGKGKGRR